MGCIFLVNISSCDGTSICLFGVYSRRQRSRGMPRSHTSAAWRPTATPSTAPPSAARARENPPAPNCFPSPARPPASAPAPTPGRHCTSSSQPLPHNPWTTHYTPARVSDRDRADECVRCAKALRRASRVPGSPGLTSYNLCGCWPLPSSFLLTTSSFGLPPGNHTAHADHPTITSTTPATRPQAPPPNTPTSASNPRASAPPNPPATAYNTHPSAPTQRMLPLTRIPKTPLNPSSKPPTLTPPHPSEFTISNIHESS